MVQKTSWKGVQTKRLRKGGLRGGYTRYADRRKRSGLQVVKNRKNYNAVFTPSGKLVGIEPKYHNYSSNDQTAKINYEKFIKRKIPKKLRKKIIR